MPSGPAAGATPTGTSQAAATQTDPVSTAAPETVPAATETITELPSYPTQVTTTSCYVRCDKHCSYPGNCRKYQDSNNNGFCDLGECM